MKDRTSFWNRLGNAVAGGIVIAWILSWCFRSRLGMFLLLTGLGGLAAVFIIGGTVNMIAWNWMGNFHVSLADEGWFWAICFLGSAAWTLDYLLTREKLLRKPVEEDDDED